MVEHEQVRPLAPATFDSPSSDDNKTAAHLHRLRRKKCLKCCACIGALLLIQAVVIVILIFTVFRVKDPIIKMNGVTVAKLELVNGTTPKPGVNMTLIADVSVKNPNVASFRYSNTTTTVYYRGVVVGEARGPAGQSRARRTTRMNITVDLIPDRIMSVPELLADVGSGMLMMTSYSRVGGRVKILKIVRKHVTVKMNCTMTVNITSRELQHQKCKRHVDI